MSAEYTQKLSAVFATSKKRFEARFSQLQKEYSDHQNEDLFSQQIMTLVMRTIFEVGNEMEFHIDTPITMAFLVTSLNNEAMPRQIRMNNQDQQQLLQKTLQNSKHLSSIYLSSIEANS